MILSGVPAGTRILSRLIPVAAQTLVCLPPANFPHPSGMFVDDGRPRRLIPPLFLSAFVSFLKYFSPDG